jgi:FtsZ-binding cell division protein ZapB|tara:strand:+ start:447 stop:716 length:270 start_codon:yes stop_codon:yes gene_type:complete
MKITKQYLKQLIIEELKEQGNKLTSSEYKKQQIKAASKTQSGVDDKERALLNQIESKLKKFAAKTNLAAGGRVTQLLKQLNAELDKVLK